MRKDKHDDLASLTAAVTNNEPEVFLKTEVIPFAITSQTMDFAVWERISTVQVGNVKNNMTAVAG